MEVIEQLEFWPTKFTLLSNVVPKGARILGIGYQIVRVQGQNKIVQGVYYVEEGSANGSL